MGYLSRTLRNTFFLNVGTMSHNCPKMIKHVSDIEIKYTIHIQPIMPEREVITSIESRHVLMELIKQNPGHIVIKLGASWCGPCKRIEKNVNDFFIKCPPNIICCDIDIDNNFDMYAFLKTKRMVDGVPTVLVYSKGNDSFIPDHLHSGGDVIGFESFASAMLRNFSK